MADFFRSQIDYIYFLYGLSFLILAAISFSRANEKIHSLPWVWLALFGLTHGVYEWTDNASLFFPDDSLLMAFSVVLLACSYLCLFEFSRKAFITLFGRSFPAWIYPLAACAAAPAGFLGLAALKGGIRYFLGLPSGILFILAIRAFSARTAERSLQIPLRVLAVAFGIYTVFSGIIVLPSHFLLGRWLNNETFEAFFGFPVQVLRGAMALLAASALWSYSERSKELTTKTRRYPLRLQVSTWLMVILFSITGLGWLFVHQLGGNARKNLISDSQVGLRDLEYNLLAEFNKSEQAAVTISGSPWIWPALTSAGPQDIANANSVLARYKRTFGLSECFLLTTSGKVIAASNWSEPSRDIGKEYHNAPYFVVSTKGRVDNYFQASAAGERWYYASAPVYNEEDIVIGVVVMKKNIAHFEQDFGRWPYCFLVSPEGNVFLSSQKRFRSRNLWPRLSGEATGAPGKPFLHKEVFDGDTVQMYKDRFFVLRQFIGSKGWSLLLLRSSRPILNARLFGIITVLFLSVMVVVLFIAVRQRENLLSIVSSVNAQLKTVLDAATQVSIIATEVDGLVTVFNTGAQKMLGYADTDMVEMHTPEILFPEKELSRRGKALSLEYGYPIEGFEVLTVNAKHGRSQEEEWTYLRKDGSSLTVNLSVTPQRDQRGQITGYLFVAMDITERKLSEYRLQEQKEFAQNLVQNSAIATFVLDAQHKVIFWNKACEELTGFSAAGLIGSRDAWKAFYKEKRPVLAEFVIDRDPHKLAQLYKSCGKSTFHSQGICAEGWYRNLNGKDRYIIFEAAPIYNAKEELIAVIETLQDITARKQAEETASRQAQELTRSNTELERFAYVASHDLQEPLRMVSSYVQLIEKRYKGMLDKDADEFIAYAADGVNWMQCLINALLTYSRVGMRRKEFEKVDCNEARDQAFRNLRLAIEESGAKVTSEHLPVVRGDSSQLTQLFQNLIGNAIKFRSERVPEVKVSVQRSLHEWIFSVSDNGIGIDPQYFSRMFEIFQRLHPRKEYPGTGIGLAVCKKIVEQHGGRIWVESVPQQGSTFYFSIPVLPGDDQRENA